MYELKCRRMLFERMPRLATPLAFSKSDRCLFTIAHPPYFFTSHFVLLDTISETSRPILSPPPRAGCSLALLLSLARLLDASETLSYANRTYDGNLHTMYRKQRVVSTTMLTLTVWRLLETALYRRSLLSAPQDYLSLSHCVSCAIARLSRDSSFVSFLEFVAHIYLLHSIVK